MLTKIRKAIHEITRPIINFYKFLLKAWSSIKIRDSDVILDVDSFQRNLRGKVIPQNWGDDLNAHFLETIFGKRFVCTPTPIFSLFSKVSYTRPHYYLIGSIIHPDCQNEKKRIVWGSGLMRPLEKGSTAKSQTFLAVRGPLTRKSLLEHGATVPEIYGDPALLLPRFYTPPPLPEKRVAIVAAWWEYKNPAFAQFCKNAEKQGAYVVHVRGYKDWRHVIRDIAGAEFVISSSLHGIITAEAYKTPCLWAIFSPKKNNEDHFFKYRDFYQSIGKEIQTPVLISETTSLDELREKVSSWTPGKIDTDPLLSVAPFPIVKQRIE